MPLYPDPPALRHHTVPVSGGHVLHVDEHGTLDGIPAVVVHGGPGSGSSPLLRRFFDPARYRLVSIDQRGSGRSTPRGATRANTTPDLLHDMESVRLALGLDGWLVVGGSWGAALALAYASTHPSRVTGLLLRATFLARREDIDGFFRSEPGDDDSAWSALAHHGPTALLPELRSTLSDPSAPAAAAAALAWRRWEFALAGPNPPSPDPEGDALAALIDRYRVQSHYLVHRCWLEDPPLLERAYPDVPTLLLHGAADRVCRPEASRSLHARLPQATLRILDGVGHDPTHPAMVDAMVGALDHWASTGRFTP